MSANVDAANSLKDDFNNKLNENNYGLDFVYNAKCQLPNILNQIKLIILFHD